MDVATVMDDVLMVLRAGNTVRLKWLDPPGENGRQSSGQGEV